MLQLRQFDLQLALETPGPLGEDIEDEASPVEHAALQLALQVALLARGEFMVKQHDLRFMLPHQIT